MLPVCARRKRGSSSRLLLLRERRWRVRCSCSQRIFTVLPYLGVGGCCQRHVLPRSEYTPPVLRTAVTAVIACDHGDRSRRHRCCHQQSSAQGGGVQMLSSDNCSCADKPINQSSQTKLVVVAAGGCDSCGCRAAAALLYLLGSSSCCCWCELSCCCTVPATSCCVGTYMYVHARRMFMIARWASRHAEACDRIVYARCFKL